MAQARIYLDHAATSWPKSPQALAAAQEFIANCGAASGRGSYSSAQTADRWVQQARTQIAELLSAASTHEIAFCHSGTHALNAILYGLIQPGDTVLTSESEHNSVLRPLVRMRDEIQIDLRIVPADDGAIVSIETANTELKHTSNQTGKRTWIVITHASNVTGGVQDLAKWSELAKRYAAELIVDASQTLGYLPIPLEQLNVTALASAGHKGLRALAGTGLVAISNTAIDNVRPIMQGGTGVASEQIDAPDIWPHVIEVGNLNVPGIVSMAAAAQTLIAEQSIDDWKPAFDALLDGLRRQRGLNLVGDKTLNLLASPRVPLISLTADNWDNHDLATVLDTEFGIECRSGFHCAGAIHERLGSSSSGTLRLSVGHSTTIEEIDSTLRAFKCILG